MACVNIPYFSLQITLRAHPLWQPLPVAVLSADTTGASILECNRHARDAGITPSMSRQEAMRRAPDLQTATVSAEQMSEASQAIYRLIFERFSPRIEISNQHQALYWLDVKGLQSLFGSFQAWGQELQAALRAAGFFSSIVVGLTRFYISLIAAAFATGIRVYTSLELEREVLFGLPLHKTPIPPAPLLTLSKLGTATIADLCALPKSSLKQRFGNEVFQLHDQITNPHVLPLQSEPVSPPNIFGLQQVVGREVQLEFPVINTEQLIFAVKGALSPILRTLFQDDHQYVQALQIVLHPESPAAFGGSNTSAAPRNSSSHQSHSRPTGASAAPHNSSSHQSHSRPTELRIEGHHPTRDPGRLIDWIRLRCERLALDYSVHHFTFTITTINLPPKQQDLFSQAARLRLEQANLALDRIRNQFGNHTVLTWEETPDQRPEKTFHLHPLKTLSRPSPSPLHRQLIRSILRQPLELNRVSSRLSHQWHFNGIEGGGISHSWGPYLWSGGWWNLQPEARTYHYIQNERGDIFWVYYCDTAEQWFVQGFVG